MKSLVGRKRMAMAVMMSLVCSVLLLMAASAWAANRPGTHTVPGYSRYKSIVGITVAQHWSTTTYTNQLHSNLHYYLTTPKSTTNDWWTLPPTSVAGSSRGWNWYSTTKDGSGQSYIKVTFKWGVPTPWGSVGGEFTDTHEGNVFAMPQLNPYVTYLP